MSMGPRPYKLRDTHRHHQHHRSRSVADVHDDDDDDADAQRNAVAVTDASGGREVSAAAPTSTSVQNFFQDEDNDLGDDWLSEDEQLFSLLVDDVERQAREAKLRQQTAPTLSASTRRDLPPLPRQHLNLRRSITDIEDHYATSNPPRHSAPRSPKVARRGGHQCHSLDTANETRLIEDLWRQQREEAPIAQNEEGEGRDSTSPTALSRVGATGVWGVDSLNSPEGRRRDRERDAVIAQQQVAEFTALEDSSQSQNLPSTDPITIEQSEAQVLGAHTSVDPTVSLLSPPRLRNKSPLELFRSPPRKTLSVTDLVSLAWCELQYWYTLAYHGRKPPTEAMKMGTKAHKTLEDQVHTTVPVDVMTREDGWALRIWNLIQGLRTLRETGVTRELEVWGVIDGELVTGIIDQVATECPDTELEKLEVTKYGRIRTKTVTVERQVSMPLDQFLMGNAGGQTMSVFEAMMGRKSDDDQNQEQDKTPKKRGRKKKETRYYITDIKTRGGKSASVPTMSSTGFKPTGLQLQLYYHILTRLVTTDDVTIEKIADRHTLDIDLPFSDSFIAQVAGIEQPEFAVKKKRKSRSKRAGSTSSSEDELNPALDYDDIINVMLKHNTLRTLWPLMKEQLRLTFLSPAFRSDVKSAQSSQSDKTTASTPTLFNGDNTLISPLVTATYISPHDPASPTAPLKLLGSRSFIFKPDVLYPYLVDTMRWWRGYRETKGVPVFEAWKCGFCEFRDICSWRREKEEELAQRASARTVVKEQEREEEERRDEERDVQDEEIKETDLAEKMREEEKEKD